MTELLLAAVSVGLSVLLAAGVLSGWVAADIGLAMMIPVGYAGFGLWLYQKKIIGHSGMTEAVVDLQYICAGLVALLVS